MAIPVKGIVSSASAVQDLNKLVCFRFGHIAISIYLFTLCYHLRIDQAGKHDHMNGIKFRVLLDTAAQGQAVHTGHLNVRNQDHGIRSMPVAAFLTVLDIRQSLFPIDKFTDVLITGFLQCLNHTSAHGG